MNEDRMVLDVALEAGCILLKNGAEIFRVEETVYRICHYYGIKSCSVFTLTNGIFLTAGSTTDPYFAKVKHLPVGTIEEVEQQLKEIQNIPEKSNIAKIMASGIGCGAFCFLFNGNYLDALTAAIAGILYYVFTIYINRNRMSKITGNLCGGILLTIVCLISYHFQIGQHMDAMIAGSIMPLVPGVPFTNSIRDFADGDYISGAVRMLDAVLVFFSIAMGIGFVFLMYHHLLGGNIL